MGCLEAMDLGEVIARIDHVAGRLPLLRPFLDRPIQIVVLRIIRAALTVKMTLETADLLLASYLFHFREASIPFGCCRRPGRNPGFEVRGDHGIGGAEVGRIGCHDDGESGQIEGVPWGARPAHGDDLDSSRFEIRDEPIRVARPSDSKCHHPITVP